MNLHPHVERLGQAGGSCLLTLATLQAWLQRPGDRVLFFSGDPQRFGEALDVAVVLPELRKAFAQRFEIAGGPIRSAAFNACLHAAELHATPRVAMPQLLLAIKRELEKAGRETQREQFGPYAQLLPEHA